MSHAPDGLDWTPGSPRSHRFGDVYFSAEDGLAESRAVFLEGCGLPDAWTGRRRFVVGELGFGTGLNIAALIDLWRRAGPPDAHLHVFSVEAYPIAADEAARALSAWPELAPVADRLLAAWPDGRRGFHRAELRDWRVTLDVAVADVAEALEQWRGRADAWFLDGFSPALNPQMWTPQVLALVAARSAPGARAATFTVAGAVRRGLEAAGFAVERRSGHGRKRERLEARLSNVQAEGAAPPDSAPPRVAVIGAGIAGASLARAFAALGVVVIIVEAAQTGAGASGNPAALVTPRLDAGLGAVAALHAQAFARAVDLYRTETPDAVVARGALQLERQARDAARFDALAGWDGFAPGALARWAPEEVAGALGEPAGPASPRMGALVFRDALVIQPAAVLDAWLAGAARVSAEVTRLECNGGGWRLLAGERIVAEADAVVVASGPATSRLLPDLPLRLVRGQTSWAKGVASGPAAAWGGYALPTRAGVLFGATHDRDDTDAEVRDVDHARNLALLAQGRPGLAASLAGAELGGRASVRATTPDHDPVAGEVAPGLYVLSGLGGRGFTLAPLLAEQIAACVCGAPSPLPAGLAQRVHPGRFEPKALV